MWLQLCQQKKRKTFCAKRPSYQHLLPLNLQPVNLLFIFWWWQYFYFNNRLSHAMLYWASNHFIRWVFYFKTLWVWNTQVSQMCFCNHSYGCIKIVLRYEAPHFWHPGGGPGVLIRFVWKLEKGERLWRETRGENISLIRFIWRWMMTMGRSGWGFYKDLWWPANHLGVTGEPPPLP